MLTKGKRIGREGDALRTSAHPTAYGLTTGNWARSDGEFDQRIAVHHPAGNGNIPANTVKPVA